MIYLIQEGAKKICIYLVQAEDVERDESKGKLKEVAAFETEQNINANEKPHKTKSTVVPSL